MIGKKKTKTEDEDNTIDSQEQNNVKQEETSEEKQEVKPEKEEAKTEKHSKSEKKKESKEEELQQKLDEQTDKYLRLYSEFDNYRKRTLKERIELSKNASEDIITNLLPVIDDLERAIKSFNDSEELKPMKEGVVLIYSKLMNILGSKGLEAIESIGKEFNTDFHEAITQIPAPSEDMKNKIMDEIQKGYQLNGKVIRFAKVVIGN